MGKIFSSVFPIDSASGIEELGETARKWISGSPHHRVEYSDLEGMSSDKFDLKKGNVSVNTLRRVSDGGDNWGMRYAQKAETETFYSELVGEHKEGEFMVSMALNYEANKIGPKIDEPQKPRILTDIINSQGGDYDGKVLKTQTRPYFLNHDSIDFVAEIINNDSDNTLPIIYLSRDNMDEMPLSNKQIHSCATLMAGMAHVLVEPSRDFSFELKKHTNKNTYNGAIGIYWPNGMVKKTFPESEYGVISEIYNTIREYSLNLVLPRSLTFEGLRSMQAYDRMDELKQETAYEKDEVLRMALEDISAKDREIEELRETIGRMHGEAVKDAKRSIDNDASLLRSPKSAELYPGEIRDKAIDALKRYADNIPHDSRRYDLIKDIISVNKQTGKYEKIVKILGSLFKGKDRKIGSGMEKRLNNLGFALDRADHHKIYIPGHESRSWPLGSTDSENRAGKNALKDIKKKLL